MQNLTTARWRWSPIKKDKQNYSILLYSACYVKIFHILFFIIHIDPQHEKLLLPIAEWTICKCEGQGQAYGSGDGTAQDCVFPFKHNGKTYNSCATPADGKGPYCATKVDSNGNLIKDKWARCNKYCDTDRGEINGLLIVSYT